MKPTDLDSLQPADQHLDRLLSDMAEETPPMPADFGSCPSTAAIRTIATNASSTIKTVSTKQSSPMQLAPHITTARGENQSFPRTKSEFPARA